MKYTISDYVKDCEKATTMGSSSVPSLLDSDSPLKAKWDKLLKSVSAYLIHPKQREILVVICDPSPTERSVIEVSFESEDEKLLFNAQIRLKEDESKEQFKQALAGIETYLPQEYKIEQSQTPEDLNKKKRPYYNRHRPF